MRPWSGYLFFLFSIFTCFIPHLYNLCPHYSHTAMTLTPSTTRTRLSTRKSSDPSTSTQWRYGRISREALPSNRHFILIPCARSYLELLFATTLYFVNKRRIRQTEIRRCSAFFLIFNLPRSGACLGSRICCAACLKG